MVGTVLFLLLCSLFSVGDASLIDHVMDEESLAESNQIHWKFCDTRFNCIIPSKYFNRTSEKSLHVTRLTRIPFYDGLQIHVLKDTTWHLTLMSSTPNSSVSFLWGNKSMLKCTSETKDGEEMFTTNDSTIKAVGDSTDLYYDANGSNHTGVVCKFALERNANINRTMAVIFGALVDKSRNQKMCIEVTVKDEKVEFFCSLIEELRPNLRLTFYPLNCESCVVTADYCEDDYNVCVSNNKPMLRRRPNTNCTYFMAATYLLVNNEHYTQMGGQIICHQDRWVMQRYRPFPNWDNPYEEQDFFLEKITNISESHFLDCRYSSPFKTICQQGRECETIPDKLGPPIFCPPHGQLTYYRTTMRIEQKGIPLDAVTCNDNGIWIGHNSAPVNNSAPSTYTLRPGDTLVCESTDPISLSLKDEFDDEIDEKEEEVIRDEAKDYTSAIVLCAVIGVISLLLLVVAVGAIASILGSTHKATGLPKSERSHRPIAAVGEDELSFSDRVSLLFT